MASANGIDLIASQSGADIQGTNDLSVGAKSGVMTADQDPQRGPPFKLTFWRQTSALRFRAEVGPVNRDYVTISMPFDFERQFVDRFAFKAARHRLECTGVDGPRTGSATTYAPIPRACPIPGGV